MENASAAFLDAVRKSMTAIRKAVGATMIDPDRLTCAERLQYEGYRRRMVTVEAILMLSRQGMSIRQIVRTTGHSRKLVRDVLRGLKGDVFRARQSSLKPICLGPTPSGRPTAATGPSCGDACAPTDPPVASLSSETGRHAGGAMSRLPRVHLARCLPRASSRS
ncbi:hypothetical protein GPNCGGLF_LOCUS4023 [Methylorubrum aminovorans]